jgi:hypothetical protein
VSSGLAPPNCNQCNFLNLLRSSWAFIWLRVSFFFFTPGTPGVPLSSVPLAAGVAAADAAGLCTLERAGVFAPLPLGDLMSAKASSTTAALPLCVIRPSKYSRFLDLNEISAYVVEIDMKLTKGIYEFFIMGYDNLISIDHRIDD